MLGIQNNQLKDHDILEALNQSHIPELSMYQLSQELSI